MNLKLLLALTVLCLPACAMQPVKDVSPASDLQALKASVERQLAPRTLPNGKQYCLELANTEGDQDDCAADLEDAFFLSEQDKHRAWVLIDAGIDRVALSRQTPCRIWQVKCQLDRRAAQRAIDAKSAPPKP